MWTSALGAMAGLIVAGVVFQRGLVRGALCGLAIGLVLTLAVNVIVPTPATCLQNSKGLDILRAYTFC